jgi:hypothetical protein
MMRYSPLLGIAMLALAPAQAGADVTATYQRPGAAGTLTIEVASNGDVRAGNDDRGYYLWTKGHGYEVRPGPGGPTVARTEDIAAARAGMRPASEIMQPWLPVDTVSINGRKGIRYFIGGTRHHPSAMPLVISRDPSLAMLATGHQRLVAMQESGFPGADSPERVSFHEVIALGAPIDLLGSQLVSISTTAIPSTRFRVPAEPAAPAPAHEGRTAVPAATDPVAPTPEGGQRGQDRFIKRAVWASDRLWLLTERGTLSSVAPGEINRRTEATPGTVADICVAGAAPVLLDADGQLSRLKDRSWYAMERLDLGGEAVQALSCTERRMIAVSRSRLMVSAGGRQRVVALSTLLTGPIVRTAPFDSGTTLFLGLAKGEWGGGLERIDTVTGTINEVPGLGGPINGVGPEPGRPGCVVATVGLVHFFPSGQVVEACGDEVRRLYYKPYTMQTSWPADPPKLPVETVPFYTVTATADGLWLAGGDGLYAMTAGRPITFRKMPTFERIDGVDISFAVPGLVLVRTDVDAHVSLGGGAPLLVAR